MPRGDPFSELCRRAAELSQPVAADLHVHTLASDGDYTPSQVLAFAQQAKLKAVAITDHDTLAGYDAGCEQGFRVRLIPGVEISTRWSGRDTHLLGLGFDPANEALRKLMDHQCALRRERYRTMRSRVLAEGVRLQGWEFPEFTPSWGRRHLAQELVRSGAARHRHEAFQKFLLPLDMTACEWVGIEDAIGIVRGAGGIASLAHPGEAITEADLAALKDCGMDAVEVAHPAIGASRSSQLRGWAGDLGLVPTGGSDCHGPGTAAIGSCGLGRSDWERFKW
jgi:predicted metal-dependent phosphoesterase TrpH